MCYSCAANSNKYFEDKKAVISKESCVSMLDNCAEFFRDILSFLNGLVKLSEHLQSTTTKEQIHPKLKASVKLLSNIRETIKKQDIIFNLNAYLEAKSTKTRADEVSKPACSSQYNLNKEPFIHYIIEVLGIC